MFNNIINYCSLSIFGIDSDSEHSKISNRHCFA